MKKFLCIGFCILIMCFLIGCGKENENIIRPPVRVGKTEIKSVSLEKDYTLEEAYEEADVVVHVKIGNWLGEEKDKGITYYNTFAVEQYKGNEIDEFVLFQDGTSEATIKNYPLFTHGNEMLLFLKKAVDSEYSNAYWIVGSYTTVLEVVEDDEGNKCYKDRDGFLYTKEMVLEIAETYKP